ncbi:uncharacterized protein AB9W97_017984 [Spinachia spinachia]
MKEIGSLMEPFMPIKENTHKNRSFLLGQPIAPATLIQAHGFIPILLSTTKRNKESITQMGRNAFSWITSYFTKGAPAATEAPTSCTEHPAKDIQVSQSLGSASQANLKDTRHEDNKTAQIQADHRNQLENKDCAFPLRAPVC